jgi:uncharacterized Zn finger protein
VRKAIAVLLAELDDNGSVANELLKALNDAVVRRLAGDKFYERGRDYFFQGRVEHIDGDGVAVRASVHGSQDYTVDLRGDDGVLDYACDCPVGSDGEFCKHCVAVALAWLQQQKRPAKPVSESRKITLADVQKVLLSEDKTVIVEKLIEWAEGDDLLRERLIMHAARHAQPQVLLATVQQAFSKAVHISRYVEYREMPSFARRVDAAIDSIDELLQDGHAAGVIELCESSLHSLTRAMESVDDSDGYMSELLGRLQEIHFIACRQAKPEPVALAKKLFEWELHSTFDVFFGAVEEYAELLGPEGLRAYRKLAEKEWASVPTRTSDSRDAEWGKHFRITHIMETLAKVSGDVAEHISVLSRDLSSAYSYLQIAEVCSKAGDHDQALQWAELGEKAFPERTDFRLREFLANEYHGRNRHDEAMKLIWQDFVERPGLESYRTLKIHANKHESWPQWRERALTEIRRRVTPASQSKPSKLFWMQPEGHSLLVQIFLYEGDADAAWSEAQQGGCRDNLWLELAAVREKDHPEDAAPIYLRQAEEAITRANNSVYDTAVALLVNAGTLMSRMGKNKDFDSLVDSLRITYKRKRNFIKLLDKKSLGNKK